MHQPVQQATPALLVIAKAPVAGFAKTRLSPPLLPEQAAAVAEAALADTLAAVLATPARRRVLVLDGDPGPWLPAGIEVIRQRGGDLAARLSDAFADVGEPALLIGMDTPQVAPRLLAAGLRQLAEPGTDAVLGPTNDGGYWAIGLRHPDRRVFAGIPMSVSWTCAAQRGRLRELGLRTAELAQLRDIDRYSDALAVAAQAPGSLLARSLANAAPDGLRTAV